MTSTHNQACALAHRQSGAALVVGLILLVAITLLALASMNTASLDLIMAGNEQYRSKAFTAAEAGIEQANNNMDKFNTGGSYSSSGTTATGEPYSYQVSAYPTTYDVTDENSIGTYKAMYFTVTSTGTSTRGATATHTEEIRVPIMDPNSSGCYIQPCALQ